MYYFYIWRREEVLCNAGSVCLSASVGGDMYFTATGGSKDSKNENENENVYMGFLEHRILSLRISLTRITRYPLLIQRSYRYSEASVPRCLYLS